MVPKVECSIIKPCWNYINALILVKFKDLFILFVWMFCRHTVCMSGACGDQMHWNYGWLYTTMWVLELSLGPQQEQ